MEIARLSVFFKKGVKYAHIILTSFFHFTYGCLATIDFDFHFDIAQQRGTRFNMLVGETPLFPVE